MDAPLNARNAQRHQDRALRIVTIIAMVPALALLIPAGVLTGNAFPALGLIPMGMSCLVGLTALGNKKDDSYLRFVVPGADFVTATFLMVLMVVRLVAVVGRGVRFLADTG